MDKKEDLIVSKQNKSLSNIKDEQNQQIDVTQKIFSAKDDEEAFKRMYVGNNRILSTRTPREAIFKRSGGGDKEYEYIIDDYVKRALNEITPFWDFIINDMKMYEFKNGTTITYSVIGQFRLVLKFQCGLTRIIDDGSTSNVKFIASNGEPMIDTAWKGCITDGFKRCGARIGIATDVYGRATKSEYHELVFYYFFDKIFVDPEAKAAKDTFDVFQNKIYGKDAEDTILRMVALLNSEPGKYPFVNQKYLTSAFSKLPFHKLVDYVLEKTKDVAI